ncbi:hypothetical protein [Arthrobacter sp. Z1-15]
MILTGTFAPTDQDSLDYRLGYSIGQRSRAADTVAGLALAQLVDRTRAQFPTANLSALSLAMISMEMELAGVVDGEGNILASNDFDSSDEQRSAYSEWVNQATGTRFNVAGLAQQLPQNDAASWDHAVEAELNEPDRAQWDVNLEGASNPDHLDGQLGRALKERHRAVNDTADLSLLQVAHRTRLQFPTASAKTIRMETCKDSDGMELAEVLDGNGHVLASVDYRASWDQRAAFSEWVSQGTGTRHNLAGLAQQLPQSDADWSTLPRMPTSKARTMRSGTWIWTRSSTVGVLPDVTETEEDAESPSKFGAFVLSTQSLSH